MEANIIIEINSALDDKQNAGIDKYYKMGVVFSV